MALDKNIQFHINKSIEFHGKWFDYSCCDIVLAKNEYPDKHERIFICPVHGPFSYTFGKHKLSKAGCPFCTPLMRSITRNGIESVIGSDKYTCSKCGIEKEVTEFPPDKRKKRGHSTRCRECKRKHENASAKTKQGTERNIRSCRRYQEKLRTKRIEDTNPSCNVFYKVCKRCNNVETRRRKPTNKLKDYCRDCARVVNMLGRTFEVQEIKTACFKCGVVHIAKAVNSTCPECREKAKRKYRKSRNKKRKALKRGAKVGHNIVASKVFNKDKWRCRQCKCKVQKKDIYADNAAELDHIVPLSIGGPHTYSNVQTLCRKCNLEKGNKFNGQLVLMV